MRIPDEFDELAAQWLREATESQIEEAYTDFDEGGVLEGLVEEETYELDEYDLEDFE